MIVIVDYGMGNVGSIKNMLHRVGAASVIAAEPEAIRSAEKLILPGVGAFDKAMECLDRLNLIGVLNEKVLREGAPLLGICLGMQLLSRRSEEGQRPGLGWIDAETVRFRFDESHAGLKLPHMGWNAVDVVRPSPILDDRHEGSRFYFVHSYHVRCAEERHVLAVATYGVTFHAAVIHGNIMGTQFHPEKSHKFGMRLLKRFAEMPT